MRRKFAGAAGMRHMAIIENLEAQLAECQRLMKKHRYHFVFAVEDGDIVHCVECGTFVLAKDYPGKKPDCKPDCLWAQAIEGE